MGISHSELLRRIRVLAEHTSAWPDTFDVFQELRPGEGCSKSELDAVQAALGIELPDGFHSACTALAGTRWSWALRDDRELEWAAEVTGARGGFHWLRPDAMLAVHVRLAGRTGRALFPFASDPDGQATWLCVGEWDRELAVLQASHDGRVEPSDWEDFLEDWSLGGFRIATRWEDQPDSILQRFRLVLGAAEQVLDL